MLRSDWVETIIFVTWLGKKDLQPSPLKDLKLKDQNPLL